MNKKNKNLIQGIITIFTLATGEASARHDLSMLYLQEAKWGSVYKDSNKPDCYVLTMNRVDEQILYVSEEPDRITGRITMNQFMEFWEKHGEKHNPNAIMHAREPGDSMRIVNDTVILSNMQYDRENRTLTYRACPVKDHVVFAEGMVKDIRLFID